MGDPEEAIYAEAAAHVVKTGNASTSGLQRALGVGYNRAARLIERMEEVGVVSASDNTGKRAVLTVHLTGLDEWLSSGKTGASAKSIVAHLTQELEQDGSYPMDGGDFARCEGLLDAVPSLRTRLPEMASVNAYWRGLVEAWDAIRAATDKTAMIKGVIAPIQEADPGHVPITPNSHMRVGPITFQGKPTQAAGPTVGRGHNSANSDTSYRVTADELRQFIERFERLEVEKRDIADAQKELMAEAKGRGYDTQVMRKVIALRKRDRDDIAEEEAVLEMYKEALGM